MKRNSVPRWVIYCWAASWATLAGRNGLAAMYVAALGANGGDA